jgi:hypothetical protein
LKVNLRNRYLFRAVFGVGWSHGKASATALFGLSLLLLALTPGLGWACACGCGVFEVGTASLYPQGTGGTVWFEYDYMNQYLNWHATEVASAGKNNDRILRTHFTTMGAQYMFNRDWGVELQLPYWYRYFKSTNDSGDITRTNFNSIGDISLMGMYTGLSEDMSLGLLGGLKVPSGWWTYPHADRDTQIGTGSTDLLFGGYKLGTLPFSLAGRPFSWYGQAFYDLPVFTQDHYKPGREFDGAVGSSYDFGAFGVLKETAPMLSLKLSDRVRDSQSQASPQNTGYTRLLLAPGGEIKINVIRLYGDVEFPLFQNMNGNQVTAPVMFKTVVSYDF